jgi:hypothetical protein
MAILRASRHIFRLSIVLFALDLNSIEIQPVRRVRQVVHRLLTIALLFKAHYCSCHLINSRFFAFRYGDSFKGVN